MAAVDYEKYPKDELAKWVDFYLLVPGNERVKKLAERHPVHEIPEVEVAAATLATEYEEVKDKVQEFEKFIRDRGWFIVGAVGRVNPTCIKSIVSVRGTKNEITAVTMTALAEIFAEWKTAVTAK